MSDLKITLEAARVNKGLTQDEAAERLGITKQTIINWEKGRKELQGKDLMALSMLYDMPVDIFLLPRLST